MSEQMSTDTLILHLEEWEDQEVDQNKASLLRRAIDEIRGLELGLDESRCEGFHEAIDLAAGLCWDAELHGVGEEIEHLGAKCPLCSKERKP